MLLSGNLRSYPSKPSSPIKALKTLTISSLLRSPSPPRKKLPKLSTATAAAAASSSSATPPILESPQTVIPSWAEFAARVSGEWDGFGADFTTTGCPIELPENVVPEAYREWGVEVFDWQTQCPTLASESGDRSLFYKLIRLLPTVGCEADAATRYSVEERVAGDPENGALAFGYDPSGCYVAVWPRAAGELELEHCLVDPGNREVRLRVVQVVKVEGEGMRLAGIRVFSEQWYGPFRNGEQLGGCAIRESGFAATKKVEVSEVIGEWQSMRMAVFRSQGGEKDIFHELIEDRPQKSIRDEEGLVALPKQLWCSLKEKPVGEISAEVGWLADHGRAMTSRCVFLHGGRLKEIALTQEVAVPTKM
ncbi:hypothetical protein J5N97_021736 [Dioscorea zingiberensis]|uniref:DUF3598 domain-containing protein n=1 Tax=Dioscorea zingiberensis TaxID=325984 RepID=A0A9D5C9Q3_9LILI|nr:hypothetical protein J5N97_021736 [Dioscorea zingiberensis]